MKKRFLVFLEFLIGGIFLGVIEDIIIIKILTEEPITLHILWIVLIVTIPFAFIGEYVVDKIDFIKIFNLNKKYRKIELFIEFLIFGVVLGVVEDLTAFYFAVGDKITLHVIIIIILIAIPFAFIGELIIDRVDLLKTIENKKLILKY